MRQRTCSLEEIRHRHAPPTDRAPVRAGAAGRPHGAKPAPDRRERERRSRRPAWEPPRRRGLRPRAPDRGGRPPSTRGRRHARRGRRRSRRGPTRTRAFAPRTRRSAAPATLRAIRTARTRAETGASARHGTARRARARREADRAALGQEHVEHAHRPRLGPGESRLRVDFVPVRYASLSMRPPTPRRVFAALSPLL